MVGTSQGYIKTRAKLVAMCGGEEEYLAWKRENASKGGKNGTGHEFAHGKADPSVCGVRGGSISRRRKRNII